MRNILVFILIILFSVQVKGQQNNTLFLMHDLPQSNFVNPALAIKCKWFIGVPGISSTHVNGYSTGFSYSDILVPSGTDSLHYDFNRVLKKFENSEMIATQTHLSLLSVGYKTGLNYFTFGVNEKVNSYTIINKNAALLLHGGNSQFEGKKLNMNGTRPNAIHYREYALGWARQIDPKLSLGFRVKLLFGKSNIYTKPVDLSLYTNPISFETFVSGSGEAYISLPVDVIREPDGRLVTMDWQQDISKRDYLMSTDNIGFGADFGFVYQLNEKTTLSGSLLDIGYINWKKDAYYMSSSGSMDITAQAIEDGLANLDDVTDSLTNVFTPRIDNESYLSPLVPAMYLGVSHTLNSWLNAGAVFHTEAYQNRLHPSFTFSGNAAITKNIYGSASYTLQNGEFNNFGAGIGAKFGVLHLHAVSDNIPAFFDLGVAKSVNLRFGLALMFGCGREKKIRSSDDNGIRALPCFTDPYKSKMDKQRNKRR